MGSVGRGSALVGGGILRLNVIVNIILVGRVTLRGQAEVGPQLWVRTRDASLHRYSNSMTTSTYTTAKLHFERGNMKQRQQHHKLQ